MSSRDHEYRVRWQREGRGPAAPVIYQTEAGARAKLARLLGLDQAIRDEDLDEEVFEKYADMPPIVESSIEVRDVGPWRTA